MGVRIEIIDGNNDFGFKMADFGFKMADFGLKMADFAKTVYTVPNAPNQI